MSAKKPVKELRLHYDATLVEEADDGDTTHYGGVWSLNGEERQARGDDRSDNYMRYVKETVLAEMEKLWPKETMAEYDFLSDTIDELIEGGPADGGHANLFTFVAKKVKGKLDVWGEPTPKKVLRATRSPAELLGDLLGDLLAGHLDEHEDELAAALAESVEGEDLGKLKPTDDVLNAALAEAMGYVREAMRPVLRKALTAR